MMNFIPRAITKRKPGHPASVVKKPAAVKRDPSPVEVVTARQQSTSQDAISTECDVLSSESRLSELLTVSTSCTAPSGNLERQLSISAEEIARTSEECKDKQNKIPESSKYFSASSPKESNLSLSAISVQRDNRLNDSISESTLEAKRSDPVICEEGLVKIASQDEKLEKLKLLSNRISGQLTAYERKQESLSTKRSDSQENKDLRYEQVKSPAITAAKVQSHGSNCKQGEKGVIDASSGIKAPHRTCYQDDEDEEKDEEEDEMEDEDALPPVVSFSKNQRWPEDEEPVCVICGKYGEYICDQTEADVCSLECKAKHLVRRGLPAKAPGGDGPSKGEDSTTAPVEEEMIPDPLTPYVYKEHEDISDLTNEQIQDIKNEVQIFVEGMNVPRPIMEFEQLNLPKKLLENLTSSGYETPTPIQMQAVPTGLTLRDLMVCAQTSSGKTASFLIPAIIKIYNQLLTCSGEEKGAPYVLILAPSRELAMQIEEQAKQLMKGMASMKTALLIGGLPLPPQLHRLRQGIQFIVGTPGRILEIIKQEGVVLGAIQLVVIDEMDTLLHLGFQQQVYDIMVHLPDSHQTILTSATIPSSIEKMAISLLNNPVFISVGTPSTPCASVRQVILWVEDPSKKKKLFAILQDPKHFKPPAIVFVDSKMGADLLAQAIHKSCGLSVGSLHGDKPQTQRNEALQRFRDGAFDVLVTTGVLGRGIDLPGVKMVINFDMPPTVEEYIHQIGRTGRLGSRGTAMTFINNNNKKLFLQLTGTLKPLGVVLPPELVNSPHLSYQRQKHRSSQSHGHPRGGYTSRECGGSSHRAWSGSKLHDRKRKKDGDNVADILKNRKRKFRP